MASSQVNLFTLIHEHSTYDGLRFNPIFVIPIPESIPEFPIRNLQQSTPIVRIPGRRTGFGSAKHQPTTRTPPRIPIRGFRQVSFLRLICLTGLVPPFDGSIPSDALSLEEIRRSASRPLAVFPECTTSNGRGILRFASVFQKNVPVKTHQIFVMSVR